MEDGEAVVDAPGDSGKLFMLCGTTFSGSPSMQTMRSMRCEPKMYMSPPLKLESHWR